MAVESKRVFGRHTLRIVRPLLAVWRDEIDAYVRAQRGLKWREDLTNADPRHATRNRLRADVLPLLAQTMGRDVKPALWRTADILRTEETWIDGLLAMEGVGAGLLPLQALTSQPVAKQRRVIRAWLAGGGVPRVGYDEVEKVRALLALGEGPAKINLPGDWHARRRQGVLFLERPRARAGLAPRKTTGEGRPPST